MMATEATDNGTIITGDGCRIAYQFDGPDDAPLLLLSNSLGTSLAMWDPQMEALARDFRILRYDQRGHGASDAPAGGYSIDRLGRDVVELLDALNISTMDFCGLSLGGMVGQWLGIREPQRLRRLILANTSAYMGPPEGWDARIRTVRAKGMAPLAQASVERWFTAAFAAAEPTAITPISEMLLASSPQGYGGTCAAIRDMDMRRMISLITLPTLVIGGTQDRATTPLHAEALASAIANARLVMLDAAHLSNVEQPITFTSEILRFLTH